MEYEIIIGLEVHSQLLTDSKMFCSCSPAYQDAPPNTMVCPVCMGMPGVLPVINEKAVEYVIRTGLALDCDIAVNTKFDRKNYPYPDLMKGYQISQYDLPIASNGKLTVEVDGEQKDVGITRVHLEEDVAKLLHRSEEFGEGYSLLDINRAGVPLMEVVSEPDIRSAEEAQSYLTRLRSIVQYIGVSAGNMEEGNFRCDANISIRPFGSTELGPKVEVKNMNSFRGVYGALEYESERQIRAAREGEQIFQETRGWDDARGITVPQRSKEYAHDYRYFPEPDLPPLVIRREWVDEIKQNLPELPEARKERFSQQYSLSEYDANLLTSSKPVADYFESVLAANPVVDEARQQFAKIVSNWILGEVLRLLNQTGTEITEIKIKPRQFVELLELIDAGTLSNNMAKTVFEEMFNTGASPNQIAEQSGMVQISDTDAISDAADEAIQNNPKAVDDYMSGKDSAVRFLVGQVMKATRGKANPQLASEMLTKKLESMREFMNGHAHLNGNRNGHHPHDHRPLKWAYLFKLFYPGVGIKRWLLLGAVGISLCSIGLAVVLRRMLELTLPDFMPFSLEGMFFIASGLVTLALSGYGLFHTIGPLILSHKTIDGLANTIYTRRSLGRGPRIVTIGGGTGLGVLLRGLKHYTDNITAIVTVGDDGGSSGRLRDELGVLPPGDFRNCLVALSEAEPLVTKLFQYRFDEGNGLKGHSFGNLFIAAMTEITNSFESALRESSRVLAVHGQILPSTVANLQLSAELRNGERINGESSITARGEEIGRLFLLPENVEAYPLALQAIEEAQLIVIGPGSLYTSILPNLLVTDICHAIENSSAPRIYVSNVATEQGETEGFSVADHLASLQRHTSAHIVDYVIGNSNPIEPGPQYYGKPVVHDGRSLRGVKLRLGDVADVDHPVRHDSEKLARTIMDVYHRERKNGKNKPYLKSSKHEVNEIHSIT